MAELDITTMSSKGQIVIPQKMRKGFHEGEKFVVIKAGNQLILKSVAAFEENIKEDLEFARRTDEALARYENGKFKSMSSADFFHELDKW